MTISKPMRKHSKVANECWNILLGLSTRRLQQRYSRFCSKVTTFLVLSSWSFSFDAEVLKPYVRSRFRVVHPYQNTSSGYNLFVGCLWSSQTIKFESFLGQIPSHSNTSGESQVFRYSSTGDNPWQLAARTYSDLNDFHKGGVDLNTSYIYIFTRLGILIIFSVRWPCSDKPSTLCVWVEQSGRWSFLACTFGSQCPDTEQRRHRRHKRVFGRAHPTSATKPISRDSNHSRLRISIWCYPKRIWVAKSASLSQSSVDHGTSVNHYTSNDNSFSMTLRCGQPRSSYLEYQG